MRLPRDAVRSRLRAGYTCGKAGPYAAEGMQTWLDAPVREAAVVYINGQRRDRLVPPYRLDVSAFVKPGRNELRVDVGNLAVNYMAADRYPITGCLTFVRIALRAAGHGQDPHRAGGAAGSGAAAGQSR